MYIISKHKDYYDTAMGYGIDKTTVYKRTLKEKKIKKEKDLREEDITFSKYAYAIEQFVIGFCGEMYPGIKVTKRTPDRYAGYINPEDKEKEFCFYNADDYMNFLKEEDIGLQRSSYYYWGISSYSVYSEKEIKDFFKTSHWNFLEKNFHDFYCPVFIYKTGRLTRRSKQTNLTLNPVLKDFKFVKVKDPYTAFQEVYMYLAGVLGNTEKDTTNISDKHRIQQKGFDKWSFRKMPQKNKKK